MMPDLQTRTLSSAARFLRGQATILITGFLLLVGLYALSKVNYLLFHTLAELFSVVIAGTVFVLTWNARRTVSNGYLLFVGISLLFIGGLDTVHTLAFKGVGVFPGTEASNPEGANLATQLWLASRYLQAVSLAVAPLFLNRRFRTWPVVAGFTLVTALLLLSIFVWQIFPVAFTGAAFNEGRVSTPLTPFKIASEYVIIGFYLVGMALLVRARKAFDPDVFRLLLASIAINIPADFFFTAYLNPYDFRNLLGHFFKIAAFYLIYKAIIETAFIRPQALLYRDLQQREQALRESGMRERARAAQLEAIMEAVPAVVWIAHDRESRLVTGNRVSTEFLRLKPSDNHSKTAPDGQAPNHFKVYSKDGQELAPHELPLQISARTGRPVRGFEEKVVFEDGAEYRLLGNVTPLLDDAGDPYGAVSVFMDITERSRAEQALQESENRYRRLFEAMAEGLSIHEIIYDEQGRAVDYSIIDVNPAFERLTGMRPEQVVGRTIREIVPSVSQEWIDRYAQVAETGQPVRFEDYSTLLDKYFEVLVYRIGECRVAALSVDVTERYRSQEAVRRSEARLRRLVDSNIIGITYSEANGHMAVANDAFLDIVGYTREDFETGKVNWAQITPPEYLPLDEQAIEEANLRGACTPYQKEYVRKDGTRVPVVIGFAYFADIQSPYICFILDLSPQKRAEEAVKEYAEQLERSNRELQNFAFVASHDLQEPLRKIQAFGERLSFQLRDQLSEESRDYLERMLNASARMRTMINDLLSLSRVTTQGRPFRQVNLNEITREVLSDLELRIERTGGQVEVERLPEIEADPLQMHQLLQNLISNALKFHRPDVPPKVRVYSECPPDRRQVIIYVEDNGVGFEQQYVDRIFQPFQRLHGMGQYEGSGIGLAICRKIIERHSGMITARSTPGQGSVFEITLPIRQPTRRDERS